MARKRAKKRRRAVTWHRRTTGGYCSRSARKESTRRDSPFRETHSSLLISACGTLSLSILGLRYPQAGPPGRLTSGKVIFPRVARCFYVAEKIKLGNPGGKESELL